MCGTYRKVLKNILERPVNWLGLPGGTAMGPFLLMELSPQSPKYLTEAEF